MTAYVIYNELEAGRLKMDELVTISEKAWRMGGSRMYVEVDSKVSVESLLKGLIIQSGNDASVALAEYIAGSESAFVSMMNQYAADLGMTNTNYVNSTGWPHSGHRTTARDIITLSAAIIREFPDHYKWYSEKDYKYNNIKQYNRNKLLWRDNSVDGLKTGHTDSAGYCLVSSAKRSDMRLISAVLGTKSEKARSDVSRSLLNYGFRFYETHKLYSAGEALHQSRIWRGEVDQVSLGISSDLHITIPRGSYKRLKPSMDIDTKIEAPVEKGSQLGVVRIILNKKELSTTPLVALESVEEGNIFQLAKDYIISLFI
jgi:D-alanyl-D-alanine carboxypeptidase (penicillin-binding protein 5/6)